MINWKEGKKKKKKKTQTYVHLDPHKSMQLISWGWLVGFYGISTFVCYLMPNPFYTDSPFYFKQFSLAWVHSFIVKTFLFQATWFSQTVLI